MSVPSIIVPSALHVSSDALEWALRHVESFGDTDIFPVPFEFAAIRNDWAAIQPYLASQNIFNWAVGSQRRCLTPKHRFGFRVATQLDPFDTLLYLALIYETGGTIEGCRASSAINVHSYRFAPDEDGGLFEQSINFETFRTASTVLADSGAFTHVVVADIADFYPRIYSHPLENALLGACGPTGHARGILKLLEQWNYGVSYGIPVGPSPSRLLAELAIADIDAALLSESYQYSRFVDDFHIFCESERQAYQALAFLARVLFENHGLTLQQQKTSIIPIASFRQTLEASEAMKERQSLSERFQELLSAIGLESWYAPIEYNDLSSDLQELVDGLNLVGLLEEQVSPASDVNFSIVRFVLRRLAQLGDKGAVDLVLADDSIKRFYPIFKDVVDYVRAVRSVESTERHEFGRRLLEILQTSIVGHLEYHRAVVINAFTHDQNWNNEDEFASLFTTFADRWTQRECILALGRSRQKHWFKTRKKDFLEFGPWERRAFLAGASCLERDERKFWYSSIKAHLSRLEEAIVKWANANPF